MIIVISDYQDGLLGNKRSTLWIIKRLGKYISQITMNIYEAQPTASPGMGAYLGLEVPDIAAKEGGKGK